MTSLVWLVPILAAIAYRARGSSWTTDDSGIKGLRVAKLAVGAAPVALGALMLGLPEWWASAVWLLTALADCLPHGSDQGAADAIQIAVLSALGFLAAVPIGAALLMAGSGCGFAAMGLGLLCGPAYAVGNHVPVHWHVGLVGIDEGPEAGEVLYGLTRGLFVLLPMVLR